MMDLPNNHKDTEAEKKLKSDKYLDDPKVAMENNDSNEKPKKRIRRQATPEQLANPFHGVKLKQILERLIDYYGWEYLGERTNIRCFKNNPTMKSSLGFLRKTTWAREFVEDVYLEMLEDKEKDKQV